MKKILVCILCIAMIVIPFCTACSSDPGNLYEYEEKEGGIEIIHYNGDKTKIVVPEVIDNKKVISVGKTFSGNVVVKSLTLPETCKNGNFSGCDNLEYLEIPGFTKIDSIPKNIKKIIATGMSSVDMSKFSVCEELEYLDISGASIIEFDRNETDLKTICVNDSFTYYYDYSGVPENSDYRFDELLSSDDVEYFEDQIKIWKEDYNLHYKNALNNLESEKEWLSKEEYEIRKEEIEYRYSGRNSTLTKMTKENYKDVLKKAFGDKTEIKVVENKE